MLNNGLYIVATPIGNLEDISERAKNVLESADVIACEDTRISKKLFQLLGLKTTKQFICYEDHREESVSKNLVSLIKEGKTVALFFAFRESALRKGRFDSGTVFESFESMALVQDCLPAGRRRRRASPGREETKAAKSGAGRRMCPYR